MLDEASDVLLAEANPEEAEKMRGQAQSADKAGQKFQKVLAEGLPSLEGAETQRAFVAPQYPYGRILIKAGTVVSFRDPGSPFGQRDVRRDGDIYVVFKGGICVADLETPEGQEIAEWCDAHGPDKELHKAYHKARGSSPAKCKTGPGFCRDVQDPQVGMWSEFKVLQQATASKDPAIPPTRDIDAGFAGSDGTGGGLTGQMIKSGRRQVEASRNED